MAERTHLSPKKKVISHVGSIKFQQSIITHASDAVAGPDQNSGHMTHIGGSRAYSPSGVGDDKLPVTLLEAEAPSPGTKGGRGGLMVKDSTEVVQPTPSSSIKTENRKEWVGKRFIPTRALEPPTVAF